MRDASKVPPASQVTCGLAAGLALMLVSGCGSSGSSATSANDGGPSHLADASGSIPSSDGGSPTGTQGNDGAPGGADGATVAGDGAALSPCVPAIPHVAWTSPYAGWSRGIPTDPNFFPIAVWLQGSWHATELAQLGINIYVGNNAGTDSLAASDLATLKGQWLYAILGQDSVGLANINDPTIARS